MGTILIIDDEAALRQVLARHLGGAGHKVWTATDIPEGVALLQQHPCELVYCDIRLPGESGLSLLQKGNLAGEPLIIMMTGYPTLESAREALRQGAFDYLVKPIIADTLVRSASLALHAKALQDDRQRLALHLETVFDSVDNALITTSPELKLVAANRMAAALCGIQRHHAGQSLQSLVSGCSGQCQVILRDALGQGKSMTGTRVRCGKQTLAETGQVVNVTATPMWSANGQLLGGVMAVHDESALAHLEEMLDHRRGFQELIGQSQSMQAVYRLIGSLADLDTTVLITGESGTGKELVAEAIHRQGQRCRYPLVRVNCAALSEPLLESELFGHVRGAFTGAVRDRRGRFQEADRGTLLLDEIGDISPAMQLRLLRVLQDKKVERVGDNRSFAVDVRILAATNQDLRLKVADGTFRQDLYYRLKVVELELPPLRARPDDLPMLIDHFVSRFNAKFDRQVTGLTTEAISALLDHSWPGNIRELEHAMEHAFVLCKGPIIQIEHLPRELRISDPVGRPMDVSPHSERESILAALSANNWRREQAARYLGMSRTTLFRKMRHLGIGDSPPSTRRPRPPNVPKDG
ncbi:MAG: sigma 54-interacting transcriptional regulator [Magnetococcales bacterium]|nr:sigma 54-interacting transcriptional regulator [Magnetococcales bacterium]